MRKEPASPLRAGNAIARVDRSITTVAPLVILLSLFAAVTFFTDFQQVPRFLLFDGQGKNISSESQDSVSGSNAVPIRRKTEGCLKHVLYDKPVKTGSSAITVAIRAYFDKRDEKDYPCSYLQCGPYANAICNGSMEPRNLLGHLVAEPSTIDCLKDKNYYFVTSIRDPLERWTSMFKYNKQLQGSHYGIPHTESFEYFMENVPPCVLYNYYDRKGSSCESDEMVQQRLDDIVRRFDEVIDLYDLPQTDLHKRIVPFMVLENVSDKPSQKAMGRINMTRLENERKLYDALKRKSMESPALGRTLCSDEPM